MRSARQPLLGELNGAIEVLAEHGVQLGGGGPAPEVRPRLTQVVLGGHRALLKQHVDPDRGRGEPVRRRIGGIGSDRLAEGRERVVVIEVVAEVLAARTKRQGLGRGWRREIAHIGRVAGLALQSRRGHYHCRNPHHDATDAVRAHFMTTASVASRLPEVLNRD